MGHSPLAFAVGAHELVRALETVASVTRSAWSEVPILGNVRLKVSGNELAVSGTDIDNEMTVTLAVVGSGDGAVTIPPGLLTGVLRQSKSGTPVSIVEDPADTRVVASWENAKVSVSTLPASDYPDLKVVEEYAVSTAYDNSLLGAVLRCMPTISTEETRYYLNGVCLDRDGPTGVVVSTDGHRLTCIPADDLLGTLLSRIGDQKPIIPRRFVKLWMALPMRPGVLTLYRRSENTSPVWIEVRSDGVRLRGKLIDGAYPAWQRLLSDQTAASIRVPRAKLMAALERLNAFPSRARHPSISLEPANDVVHLKMRDPGVFDADIEIPLLSGESSPVKVNTGYLLQSLKNTRGSEVTLRQAEAGGAVFVDASAAAKGEQHIVMPLRA